MMFADCLTWSSIASLDKRDEQDMGDGLDQGVVNGLGSEVALRLSTSKRTSHCHQENGEHAPGSDGDIFSEVRPLARDSSSPLQSILMMAVLT